MPMLWETCVALCLVVQYIAPSPVVSQAAFAQQSLAAFSYSRHQRCKHHLFGRTARCRRDDGVEAFGHEGERKEEGDLFFHVGRERVHRLDEGRFSHLHRDLAVITRSGVVLHGDAVNESDSDGTHPRRNHYRQVYFFEAVITNYFIVTVTGLIFGEDN